MDKGESIAVGTTEYTAAADGTDLACNGGKAKLTAGAVALSKGESVTVGTTEYTAEANGTTLACDDGKAKLTAGKVALDTGESIVIGDLGSVTNEGSTPISVGKDGKLSLTAGQSVRTQDASSTITYTVSADGKTVTVEQGGTSKVWNVTDSTAGVTIVMAADGGAEKELSGAAEPEEPGGGENTGGNGGGENTGGNGGGENTGGNGGGENTGGNGGGENTGGSVGDNTGVVLKDDGSGRKDVFRGGSGADEIILGREDVAVGSEGNDEIVLGRNAPGAKIVLGGGDGHDRAEGFAFGFGEDANAVSLMPTP